MARSNLSNREVRAGKREIRQKRREMAELNKLGYGYTDTHGKD